MQFVASVVLAVAVFFGLQAIAEASHFRSTEITWEPTGNPNEVEFTVEQGWRWSAFGNPALGTVVSIGSLTFGDGNSASFALMIESIDSANDWFIGSTTITHTYPSAGPFTAAFNDCCRIGGLQNGNSGLSERIETVVNLALVNSSPVSTIFPIIQMVTNQLNSVTLPVADADGDTVTCRLSTSAESGLSTVSPTATHSLTVSPSCQLNWDTAGTGVGQLYALQVMIEESRNGNPSHGRVALDFLIQIASDIGEPPVCDTPPTPTGTITVPVGTNYTATIQGSDPDVGDVLTLNSSGLPDGATLTPALPMTLSSPVSSVFSWTPTADDVGPHVVLFSVTDRNLQQTLCSFTLDVSSGPVCGNNVFETDEQCDDGNTTSDDGCSALCQIEYCGDGITQTGIGEECDDNQNGDNGDGCADSCLVNYHPDCSNAASSVAIIWPPNHQGVNIAILGVTDVDGDPLTITPTDVFQDEQVSGNGDGAGATSPDASLDPLQVRAERNGTPKSPGNGRVYHINFTAEDGIGGICNGEVTVCVPHDRRKPVGCIDGGALYNSLLP